MQTQASQPKDPAFDHLIGARRVSDSLSLTRRLWRTKSHLRAFRPRVRRTSAQSVHRTSLRLRAERIGGARLMRWNRKYC